MPILFVLYVLASNPEHKGQSTSSKPTCHSGYAYSFCFIVQHRECGFLCIEEVIEPKASFHLHNE